MKRKHALKVYSCAMGFKLMLFAEAVVGREERTS